MSSDITDALRRLVAERADHLCEYCLVQATDAFHGCEVDHILSIKHGGLTVAENLAYACFHCNRHKGTDLGSVGRLGSRLIRFYSPRTDRWKEHFYLTEGRIDSLTELAKSLSGCWNSTTLSGLCSEGC